MKLKASRTILLKALSHIQSVAEKRNTIPILANVMLHASKDKLSLTATDTEISIIEEIDASVDIEGSATAPATILWDIVRRLPDDATIEFDHQGENMPLIFKAGRFSTSLNVLPVADFPAVTTSDFPFNFSIPITQLRELIEHTRFAISTEETRYYLNGIYFHMTSPEQGEAFRAVATDGHRLARIEVAAPEGAVGMPGVIVPRKTIFELYKLLTEEIDIVSVKLSDTRIQFCVGSVTLTSKLIDGTFPEYERVIPKNNDKVLRISKKDFSDAVARVSAISQERSRPVKLVIQPGVLVLSATSVDQGNAREELDQGKIAYTSDKLEIGFQARYLNDITDQIAGEVQFEFSDSSSPTIVRDVNSPEALYVLMPMRV